MNHTGILLYYSCLENHDFEVVAEKIVCVFPDQIAETFYTDPLKKADSKDDKGHKSKGKLVNRYRNDQGFVTKLLKVGRKADVTQETSSSSSEITGKQSIDLTCSKIFKIIL